MAGKTTAAKVTPAKGNPAKGTSAKGTAARGAKGREKFSAEQLPGQITKSLVAQLKRVARDCRADAVVIALDAVDGDLPKLGDDFDHKVIWITSQLDEVIETLPKKQFVIGLPKVALGRDAQIKMGALIALSRGLLAPHDVAVALTGAPLSGALDQLTVIRVDEQFHAFKTDEEPDETAESILPPVLERVMTIAVALGHEGREGRSVGGLFVIGDSERVLSLSRQLILNPFRGYEPDQRNILDPALEETVKELSTIDGGFVIRGDGVIESAGTLLKTGPDEDIDVPKGLGARHTAAATVTGLSNAVAIAVSESTGTVSVFRNGRIVTEVERTRGGRRAGVSH